MLDAKEIDVAIAELEYKDSSYSNYGKPLHNPGPNDPACRSRL